MARSFRHWTPRYALDRALVEVRERLHPDRPWITHQAVAILEDWLKPSDVGVEWGSGRSTLWLAKRVAELTSIEQDRDWYGRVTEMLAASAATNVDLRLCPVPDEPTSPADHPYVRAGAERAAGTLDFALVDGALRHHCMELAMSLVKPGGLLVLDNANWVLSHATRSPDSVGSVRDGTRTVSSADGTWVTRIDDWRRIEESLRPWRRIWTSNGVTDTALFIKPI